MVSSNIEDSLYFGPSITAKFKFLKTLKLKHKIKIVEEFRKSDSVEQRSLCEHGVTSLWLRNELKYKKKTTLKQL